jgi:hypothetical protein
LAPTYEALAEMLKDEDVLIAKIDAIENDIPSGYAVRG